ncbi:hypothetical protein O7626_21235 [Micromonospora sp. WMMD1102]|uniref:hypothetical protein n=1 Tax=Micromonospora sp. WMMD1102 TaxID=3016105 RepID=UPI002415908A|nr:hypothetical protein [Micromonospora sp. WMMD1102]MDG4788427.1 hypothetical protein [Micromonospora sp. WMMD1102]
MVLWEQQPVERLRDTLRAQVSPSLNVSEKRTQYWFDEDSAAYCEIDVQARQGSGDSPFVVVVIAETVGPKIEFMVRAWHRYAPEVWNVGVEQSTVTRMLRDGTRDVQGLGSILVSPLLPGVAVAVERLFSTTDSPG